MKAIVIDVQKDLFESSVLEQSGPIQFLSFEDALNCGDASCVVLGSKGIDDYNNIIRKLSQFSYKSGTALILINPPVEMDIGAAINAPVSIAIKKRKVSSICSCLKSDDFNFKKEYEIWSDGVVSSSLSSGILGIDGDRESVLLKYQPKNTSGAVFITTLKLLSYSGMTIEADREELLKLLLEWNNAKSVNSSVISKEKEDIVDESVLNTVAILVFAYRSTNASKIVSIIPR